MEQLGIEVDEIDLEKFPAGQIHRLRLRVVEDGAGFAVSLPVLVARGKKTGPVLGITAAVHGNEINGIPAIHRLFSRIEASRLRGSVVAILIVNYPGFDRLRRRYLDGADLNHIMPGKADGNVSSLYAYRVIERAVRKFNFLIDLHTASVGRINSLYVRADMDESDSAKMAHLLRPQLILHSPPRDGSIRGEATEMKIPAVTVEIGNPQRFQPEYIRSSVRGMRAVMAHLNMISSRASKEGRDPIICRRSFWTYTDRGGLLTVQPGLLDRVEAGAQIGTVSNIFGDVTATYTAPETCVVIGKSVNPVGYSGARVAHLGIPEKQ